MSISALDQFVALCRAWNEENGFDPEEVTSPDGGIKVTPEGARFKTVFRDPDNYKCHAVLTWYRKTGEVELEADFPEAYDVLSLLLERMKPADERRWHVYVRVPVAAPTLAAAAERVEEALRPIAAGAVTTAGDSRTLIVQ